MKQAIVFVWGEDKRLGYSRIDGEKEWTTDLPGHPPFLAAKCDNEAIARMTKENEAKGGKTYRFAVEENESIWNRFQEVQ